MSFFFCQKYITCRISLSTTIICSRDTFLLEVELSDIFQGVSFNFNSFPFDPRLFSPLNAATRGLGMVPDICRLFADLISLIGVAVELDALGL
jgi:hypothetical protein